MRTEPEFCLPQCYYMQPPALKTSHFGKFTLETLFYIFYNMPRDTLQAYAATELYNREWRYHKDLKLWFTRSSAQPGADDGCARLLRRRWERPRHATAAPAPAQASALARADTQPWRLLTRIPALPPRCAPRSKGQYVFFDINAWEKKTFQGAHAATGAGAAGVDGESDLNAGMDDTSGMMAHS